MYILTKNLLNNFKNNKKKLKKNYMKNFYNSFIIIMFFILFYFFIYQFNIKQYYNKKINYKDTIKIHNKLITINLYNKFNEPCLTSLKDSYRIYYYKFFYYNIIK